MPQISLYIDEETLKKVEKAAKKEHISISKWVGNNIKRSFESKINTVENNTAEWLKLAGSWEDERSADEIIADIKNSRTENKRFADGLFD